MAGFKTLNSADPSVRRPLRVSDLQDLWDGLGTIFAGVPENTVKVVSGFELDGDNTVLEGVLIYNHKLYYYEGGLAVIGDTIYLYDEPSDLRTFADGQTRNFSFINVATVAGIYDDGLVAVQLTSEFISDKLVGAIADGSVTSSKLADNAVTVRALLAGSSAKYYMGKITPVQGQAIVPFSRDSYMWLRVNQNRQVTIRVTPLAGRALTHEFVIDNNSESPITFTAIVTSTITGTQSIDVTVPFGNKAVLTIVTTVDDTLCYSRTI